MRKLFLQSTALLSILLILGWPAAAQNVPAAISHQGYVEVDGQPFTGTGRFRFAFVDDTDINRWTHDGSEIGNAAMPVGSRSIEVEEGVYSKVLGGAGDFNFPPDLFVNNTDMRLRVWFDDGTNGVQQLSPDQPLLSVPFAQLAQTARNAEAVPNEITVDRVLYNTPRTQYLHLRGADFQSYPQENHNHVVGNINGLTVDPGISFYAPVHLPDGATLTRLTIYFEDQDSDSEVQAQLRATDPSANIAFNRVTLDTSGVTGEGFKATTSIVAPVIDNQTFNYQIELSDASGDWDDCQINGVVLAYELDAAL